MYRGRLRKVSTLLLLFFVGWFTTTTIADGGRQEQRSVARADYGDILESNLIDDQLHLLGPESLLKNGRILREQRRQQQHHHKMVDAPCARDLAIYELAIKQRKSWALKMFDASSKLPAGMLQGHVIDLGMFDECMEAHGQLSVAGAAAADGTEIHGRHCMYEIHPPTQQQQRFILNPTLSICLPASCDAEDVIDLAHKTINATAKLKTLGVNVVSARCTTVPPVAAAAAKRASTAFFVSSVVAVAYTIFLVFCTIFDLAKRRRRSEGRCGAGRKEEDSPSRISETLESLSLLKNAEAIFSTASDSTNNLAVIHGIRAISTCWMVLAHEHLGHVLRTNVNIVDIMKWFSSWGFMCPLCGVFSVDTFFALSGFLMAYNFFRQIRRTNKFNVALYYLHRFIRLTFPLVVIFVATVVLLPGLGASGARYEWLQNIFVTGCGGRKGWSVLLYVQNLVETDNYCLLYLWSLSVDMQLYWLSPLLLYPLYKRPKFGLRLLAVAILASALASGWIVGANRYSSIYFSYDYNITHVTEAFRNVYQVPWTRASPWLIGIFFAYVVVATVDYDGRSSNIVVKPNKKWISIGWMLTIASFAFCIFGAKSFMNTNYEYDLWWEVTFAVLQRPLWAFGICWIIYASVHNAAGPISRLLSAKIFWPISRLSYSIYLVHILLPFFQAGVSRAPTYFNQYSIFHSYVSNMILAFILALFFSLLFEVPILILEDAIFKRKQRRRRIVAAATQKTK